MSEVGPEALPPELQIVVQYCASPIDGMLATALSLDQRLARIVAQSSEPMLAQMRLAWWREELGKNPADRPSGDAVLDAIGRHWSGQELALRKVVDGWEEMLAEPPLPTSAAMEFATGRAAVFGAIAESGGYDAQKAACQAIGLRWAFVDAALHTSDHGERELLVGLAQNQEASAVRLSRPLRGLNVLDALVYRSLRKGARPLLEGRGAALVAIRAALLGR